MKQSLNYNQELTGVKDLLSELITNVTSLKIVLSENQIMLTEAQIFFNGGIESAIKEIRKINNLLEANHYSG
jgi:hypothetical protein